MEQTLNALGGILLKAIPTIVIVLLLHWYLKAMLFGPLAKVLKQREDATIGARARAEESRKEADRKASEFDQAIVQARAEIYREQETQRKRWLDDRDDQVRKAKERAGQAVAAARSDLENQSSEAKQTLAARSSDMADEIVRTVLGQGALA